MFHGLSLDVGCVKASPEPIKSPVAQAPSPSERGDRSAWPRKSFVSALATLRLNLYLDKARLCADFEKLLGVGGRKEMHAPGDDAGPAGLMTGAEAGTVVAVKVLVEREVIAPVRILLKLASAPVDWPPAMLVSQKDAGQPARELLGDLIQVHLSARARGTFDGEIIAVVCVILQQAPDDQGVHGHPDRSAPVGVAAKHAGVGLCRQVRHPVFLVPHTENKRMLGMIAGQGANAVGAEELLLVKHCRQYPAQPGFVQNRGQSPIRIAELARIVDKGRHLRARLEEPH